jgi:hypothetical protein
VPLRRRKGSRPIMFAVIDLAPILAAVLVLLSVAVFGAMIWAGSHRH